MISPSPGDNVVHFNKNDIILAQCRRAHQCKRRIAFWTAQFFGGDIAPTLYAVNPACALPRPSAIASAKLANNTVNHSHSSNGKDKPC